MKDNWMQTQKSQKLQKILKIVAGILIFFGFFRIIVSSNVSIAIFDFAVAWVLIIAIYALSKFEDFYDMVSIIFLFTVYILSLIGMNLMSGDGTRIMWLTSIVIATFYFRDKSEAFRWTLFYSVIVFISELYRSNMSFEPQALITYVTIVANIIIISAIMSWYEDIKQREIDISLEQQNKLEEKVKEAVNRIRKKDHLIIEQSKISTTTDMLKKVAYHWIQPLNVVTLSLAKIELDLEEKKQNTLPIKKIQKRLQELSSSIHEFADLCSSNNEIVVFEISTMLDRAVNIIKGVMESEKIELKISNQEGLKIKGPVNELTQAIIAILSNAKDAIIDSKNSKRAIEITVTKKDNHALITIKDSGKGVPTNIMDKIFEAYFTTKEQGDGIGLFMVKQTIEKTLNGTIQVSNSDGGALFTITLPLI